MIFFFFFFFFDIGNDELRIYKYQNYDFNRSTWKFLTKYIERKVGEGGGVEWEEGLD
jgi:hypothetical protein